MPARLGFGVNYRAGTRLPRLSQTACRTGQGGRGRERWRAGKPRPYEKIGGFQKKLI